MSLKIRLARGGSKKKPIYTIVVADSRSPRDGKFIEKLGSYNPRLPADAQDRVRLNVERVLHWLKSGARPTDRVEILLDKSGLWKKKQRFNPIKGLPGKKMSEREPLGAASSTSTEIVPLTEDEMKQLMDLQST